MNEASRRHGFKSHRGHLLFLINMKKPKFLYHGSARKLVGDKLIPKQPKDLSDTPENLYVGVYATDVKKLAITMALLGCRGVHSSSLDFSSKKRHGIIFDGWPKQEIIYLYILSSDSFIQCGGSGRQWISSKPVKPLKIEELYVKDYLYLIRKGSKKEIKQWFEKYRKKIEKLKCLRMSKKLP